MIDKIYTLHNNKDLISVSPEYYENESLFQELIEQHPDILAGDLINPEEPLEFYLIEREINIRTNENWGRNFSMDHLFVDQFAILTFVEVKRTSDTRARREVVAQMLDYAANAIQNWEKNKLRELFEENYKRKNLSENISRNFRDNDEFWKEVDDNLKKRKIRLLFVNDGDISPELISIIEYLNEEMSNTEVLGLEIKRYKVNESTVILVPNLVGNTSKAMQVKRQQSRIWDENDFLEQAAGVSENNKVLCEKLISFFTDNGCAKTWGAGGKNGRYIPIYKGNHDYKICAVYNKPSRTFVELYFQYMNHPPFSSSEYKESLRNMLIKIPGVDIPAEQLDKRPNFELNILNDDNSFELFTKAMKKYLDDIRNYELNIS